MVQRPSARRSHFLDRDSLKNVRVAAPRYRRLRGEWLEDRSLLADITWFAPGGGAWNVATNWSPAQIPGAGDNALITLDGSYTVTVPTSQTVASLTLGATSGTQSLAVNAGTFQMDAASFVNANGILNLNNGTLTGAGSLTVGGTFEWNGGTRSGSGATILSPGAVLNIQAGGASHSPGVHTIQGAGTVNWTGGDMRDGGPLTIAALLNISGSSTKTLHNATLNVAGNAVWSGTGNLEMHSDNDLTPSTLNIQVGGVFEAQNNQQLGGGNGRTVVNNAGTFRKTIGTGETLVAPAPNRFFHNTGTVEVLSGTLRSDGGGTHSGTFSAAAGAAMRFNGGPNELNAGVTFAGAGFHRISGGTTNVNVPLSGPNFGLDGGTLTGSGTLTVSGTFDWTAGTRSGSGATVLNNGAMLNIQTGNVHTAGGHTVQGAGTVNWTDGRLSNGTLTIAALLNISGSSTKTLHNATLNVAGNAVWSGTGNLEMHSDNDLTPSTLNIQVGGVFEAQNNQQLGGGNGRTV